MRFLVALFLALVALPALADPIGGYRTDLSSIMPASPGWDRGGDMRYYARRVIDHNAAVTYRTGAMMAGPLGVPLCR